MRDWVKVFLGVVALTAGASAPTLIVEGLHPGSIAPLHRPAPSDREGGQKPKAEASGAQDHSDDQRTAHDQHRTNDDEDARDQKSAADWWSIYFTGGLVLVGLLQLTVFGEQARQLRKSIDLTRRISKRQEQDMRDSIKEAGRAATAMENSATASATQAAVSADSLRQSNRAWLRVNVEPGPSAIHCDGTRLTGTVEFKIKNLGNAPALSVSPHAWLGAVTNGRQPEDVQLQKCTEIRGRPFEYSYTIFPNEEFPICIGLSNFHKTIDLDPEEIENANRSPDGGISLWLVICVDYNFPTDLIGHHQTSFILRVRPRNVAYFPIPGTIQRDNIVFFPYLIGAPEYVT